MLKSLLLFINNTPRILRVLPKPNKKLMPSLNKDLMMKLLVPVKKVVNLKVPLVWLKSNVRVSNATLKRLVANLLSHKSNLRQNLRSRLKPD